MGNTNTIGSSNTTQTVPAEHIDHADTGFQSQNPAFFSEMVEFTQNLEQELGKADQSFKHVESRVSTPVHNHKTLVDLLQEMEDLKGKDPSTYTPEQKQDIEKLRECFEILEESSKILAAGKIYINKLKALMSAIAQGVEGSNEMDFPQLDLKSVPKKAYQLVLPMLPDTGLTTKS